MAYITVIKKATQGKRICISQVLAIGILSIIAFFFISCTEYYSITDPDIPVTFNASVCSCFTGNLYPILNGRNVGTIGCNGSLTVPLGELDSSGIINISVIDDTGHTPSQIGFDIESPSYEDRKWIINIICK